jgi:hypothetical protein
MGVRRAPRIAAAALLATALACVGPASAKTDTLARGAMNLVGTPLDIALAPYTASSSFVRKYYLAGHQSPVGKVMLTPLVGTVYGIACTGITGTVAVLRFVDGLLNVPLGLAVLGSDKQPDTAIYEPVHGAGGALVDYHGLYFGGYHCEGFFQ